MRKYGFALFLLGAGLFASQVQSQQKMPAIVSPQLEAGNKATFRVWSPKAEKVDLFCVEMQPVLGSDTFPMVKGDNGIWSTTLGPLTPGLYEYYFEIDGLRNTDPSSPNVYGNRQGSRGFVEVPGPEGKPRIDEWRKVPHGKVAIHWYDASAGFRRRLQVYTPAEYEKEPAKKYPVLYLLHGNGQNDELWVSIGRANVIADNLLAEGKMVPMLIAMPDGHIQGPQGPKTQVTFEQDLLKDVVPLVEATYRVQSDSKNRALMGLSMGGGQALNIGLKHLDKFAWVGSFSGGSGNAAQTLATVGADPNKANEQLKLLWIGIGKDDSENLVKGNRAMDKALQELKIKHEYYETAGAHRWSVWRSYLAEVAPRLFR